MRFNKFSEYLLILKVSIGLFKWTKLCFHIFCEWYQNPAWSNKKTDDTRTAIEKKIKGHKLYYENNEVAYRSFPIERHPGTSIMLFIIWKN